MSELKPCPFCGSKPFRTPRSNGDSLGFGIICANCGCESPKGITDKKAREWWNKRVKAQAVPDAEWLAYVIRKVDGKHSLGACELAEMIVKEMNEHSNGNL